MADIVVQAFAALMLSLLAVLTLVVWLNRKQERALEQSYQPGFRPQDFINALAICTNRVCRTTKKFVGTTISSVGEIAGQFPSRMPVAVPAQSAAVVRVNRR